MNAKVFVITKLENMENLLFWAWSKLLRDPNLDADIGICWASAATPCIPNELEDKEISWKIILKLPKFWWCGIPR